MKTNRLLPKQILPINGCIPLLLLVLLCCVADAVPLHQSPPQQNTKKDALTDTLQNIWQNQTLIAEAKSTPSSDLEKIAQQREFAVVVLS